MNGKKKKISGPFEFLRDLEILIGWMLNLMSQIWILMEKHGKANNLAIASMLQSLLVLEMYYHGNYCWAALLDAA